MKIQKFNEIELVVRARIFYHSGKAYSLMTSSEKFFDRNFYDKIYLQKELIREKFEKRIVK